MPGQCGGRDTVPPFTPLRFGNGQAVVNPVGRPTCSPVSCRVSVCPYLSQEHVCWHHSQSSTCQVNRRVRYLGDCRGQTTGPGEEKGERVCLFVCVRVFVFVCVHTHSIRSRSPHYTYVSNLRGLVLLLSVAVLSVAVVWLC